MGEEMPRGHAGVSARELLVLQEERLTAIRQEVQSGNRSPQRIAEKMQHLPCFVGISIISIKTFIARFRDELGIPKLGPRGRELSNPSGAFRKTAGKSAISPPRLKSGCSERMVNFDDVLSRFTPQLSYQESLKFHQFVETHLRPHIIDIEKQILLILQLEEKVAELLLEITELREHQCSGVATEAKYEIQELKDANKKLAEELGLQQQRNQILAEDNAKLRKRYLNPKHLVEHSASVRLGSDGR